VYKFVVMVLSRLDVDVERRKRVFFAFSTCWGAFAARARAERAFLGFLVYLVPRIWDNYGRLTLLVAL
jgi:hypothetical protein